ncbi:hypothetical protein [Streptomyces sp. FXY-T5]|uniref:hypothetical protein n=1 Tax=Streptomyces sp. FXY-T5 TaxID=3064901 RepID=UPI0027D235D2|nr:hypothetical protein [Streptomyces sp. FXY-T5]WMD03844.1 hypothetical protein Q7C01_05345 [Streptomyces sp. FXY-T5]
MSKPFEYADGVTGREAQGAPNVYLPQAAAPPVYDAYADPAAAHGWQDVYDTTAYDMTDGGGAGHPGGADGTGASRPGAHPADGGHQADGADVTRAYPGGPHPAGTGADGGGDTRELPAVPGRGRAAGGEHRARRKRLPGPRAAWRSPPVPWGPCRSSP